jgi:4-amino-4-deoxy-L-arabinose transferase-like glycosyltransferase
VLTTFLLAHELWGERVAWLSAALLACSHYHVHFSRLGSNQVADGFFLTLVLWWLVRGLRVKRASDFALVGIGTGLGWYGYFGARLAGVVVACYLAVLVVRRPRFLARYGKLLLIALGGVLVVVAPLLLHYGAHPDALGSRFRQVGIFASDWLKREQAITGRSTASLLAQQLWKSISAFNYTLDPTFWYGPTVPLLDFISGIFFVFGLVWVTARFRWPSSRLLLIWFWPALVLGWVVTENPPSSQRMVGLAPGLALLVGLGIDWAWSAGQRLVEARPAFWQGLTVLLVVAVAALNLGYYFLAYTPSRVYGNPTAEMATVLARHLNRNESDYPVFLYGAPFLYWDFGTLRFMARDIEAVDVPPSGEGERPSPEVTRGARMVFHPQRVDELDGVRLTSPGGTEHWVRSSADGRLLYAMYEIGR